MCVSVLIEGFLQKEVRVLKTKENNNKKYLFANSAFHSHRLVMKCKLKSKDKTYEKIHKIV